MINRDHRRARDHPSESDGAVLGGKHIIADTQRQVDAAVAG